jgi:hypothetical protein
MNLGAVLSLERMLVRAGLRDFGIPAWLATAVIGLVALLDVRAGLATHRLILTEPVASSFVLVLVSLAFGWLGVLFLGAPYVRISALTSPEEKVVHALAGLNPRSSLAAALLQRARSLVVPCFILTAAAAITPLDLSVALGVTTLLFAATLGAGAMAVLLAGAADHVRLRVSGAVASIVAAVVAAWQAHSTTGHLALGMVPILGAMICSALLAAAFISPRTSEPIQQARDVATRGCRLPSLSGGLAPVALFLAQTRARRLSILPWLCVTVAATFAMHWTCSNATSPTEVDRITLIAACLPAAFAAVDAGSTSRHFSQPLWWLQARQIDAAVYGTVIATSITQFILSVVIVATGAISGANLATVLAALILGTSVIIIARCVATLAHRRIRRSGVVGGSGLLELLEAMSAAPFAMLPVAILIYSSTSWSLPLSLIGPVGAITAASALSRSVGALGPGTA